MKLIWMDLETTGLDPHSNTILEVAVSVAEFERPFDAMPAYEAVAEIAAMDGPTRMIYADGLFKLDPFVFDMHTKNGLLVDCARSSLTLAQIEDDLLDIVPEVEDKEERPILAGSTIHFDLGFVRAHWPRLAARLSHRCYDVSAIKLFARSMGMTKQPKGEAHRARQDVEESIAHGRECAEWLKSWGWRRVVNEWPAPLQP